MKYSTQLLTVTQFSKKHPHFTKPHMRWILFHRGINGLGDAIEMVGTRVLINEEKFFLWIKEKRKSIK